MTASRFRADTRLLPLLAAALLAQPALAQGPSAAARPSAIDARARLDAVAQADEPPVALYQVARERARAGDRDGALAALARAVAAGYDDADALRRDTSLAALRGDARWAPLVAGATARADAEQAFWNGPALRTAYRPELSDDEKVAGLSRLWMEAKYNFVYFDRLPALDWDATYLEFLPRVRAARSTLDFYRVLTEFYARLGDGHTGVWMPRELMDAQYAAPLLRTERVEGRTLVVAVAPPLAAQGLAVGQEIVAVDGLATEEHVRRRILPYASASTPQDRDARAYGWMLLQGDRDSAVTLTLRDAAGRTTERRVARVSAPEVGRAFQGEPLTFRMLPGGVAYVALHSFADDRAAEAYERVFPRLAGARALVFDVRDNGGGNSSVGYRVLATLTDTLAVGGAWETRAYRPALRAWGRGEARAAGAGDTVVPNAALRFRGPVAVLTSAHTYSAAEDFVAMFRAMRRGRVVGEATGGSTGQPLMFALPGGGGARVCAKHDVLADGGEFVGFGLSPDVAVHPTIAGVRAGRDEVLAAAVRAVAGARP